MKYFLITYSKEIEQKMQLFYAGLSEKDQRHYAAQESMKLGWWEVRVI